MAPADQGAAALELLSLMQQLIATNRELVDELRQLRKALTKSGAASTFGEVLRFLKTRS